jgi:hypothetical protein
MQLKSGAHASGVWFGHHAGLRHSIFNSPDRMEKMVEMVGRDRQHAGRVRSPNPTESFRKNLQFIPHFT